MNHGRGMSCGQKHSLTGGPSPRQWPTISQLISKTPDTHYFRQRHPKSHPKQKQASSASPSPSMKRKKWTEEEEETLIDKYGELLRSGDLSKRKASREKRLQPIADHLNAAHHHRHPAAYPFLWTWRDVCVKVHNMRHQYLGVKHKIQLPRGLLPSSSPSATLFAWSDGDLHWSNFLKYKSVFGDHDLDALVVPDDDDDEEFGDGEEETEGVGERGKRKGAAFTGFGRLEGEEEEEIGREMWRWMAAVERREEEEMEWRLRMLGMQMEHEKQLMEALAESCHNQLQILGVLVRVVCQFFGNGGGDGMGGGGLVGDGGKSDPSSGGHFM